MDKLTLQGLDAAPAQALGSVRLVPLIRREVRDDLRLAKRRYDEGAAIVDLGSGLAYTSFVPHGLVASWSDDGAPVASFGASLGATKRRDGFAVGKRVRVMHRMARREDDHSLRFLPLHLAMEGFLALCFSGPEIVWSEYSRHAISSGLSPRVERSVRGAWLPGFEDALRVFEIHERQTGVLVFVADALASAFVTPHPDDYRALHTSLLADFYGELIETYGFLHAELAITEATIDADSVRSMEDLRAALGRMRDDWAAHAELSAAGAWGRKIRSKVVYQLGPHRLDRFMTSLCLSDENHIGERIVRDDGTVEYLKTYRLSDAQTRRAHLLEQLSLHGWNLDVTAAALGTSKVDLCRRIENAGFGYLLSERARAAARPQRA